MNKNTILSSDATLTLPINLGFNLAVTFLLSYKNEIIAFKFPSVCIHYMAMDSGKHNTENCVIISDEVSQDRNSIFKFLLKNIFTEHIS